MKPKVSYHEFLNQRKHEAGSIAMLIETFIKDRTQPGARPIGTSQQYTLRRLQKAEIGAKQLLEIRAVDYLNHCKARKAGGVLPQTIAGDMTYLTGALKYGFEILDLPGAEAAYAAYRKAKPQLLKEQLIAKSANRTRRPTQEELDRLLAHFALPPKKRVKGLIDMVPVVKFSYLTARRISETCRITWADLNHEKRTCLVRDLKNPNGKGFHGEFPLLGEAWDIVMAQPRVSDRIFPHRSRSVSAKYTLAKKKLGIEGLVLHDNRRHCVSNLFEQGYNVPEVQKVSLHRNASILLKNYTALKPEDLHKGPAARRTQ